MFPGPTSCSILTGCNLYRQKEPARFRTNGLLVVTPLTIVVRKAGLGYSERSKAPWVLRLGTILGTYRIDQRHN